LAAKSGEMGWPGGRGESQRRGQLKNYVETTPIVAGLKKKKMPLGKEKEGLRKGGSES